jgi:hypothetical protein
MTGSDINTHSIITVVLVIFLLLPWLIALATRRMASIVFVLVVASSLATMTVDGELTQRIATGLTTGYVPAASPQMVMAGRVSWGLWLLGLLLAFVGPRRRA